MPASPAGTLQQMGLADDVYVVEIEILPLLEVEYMSRRDGNNSNQNKQSSQNTSKNETDQERRAREQREREAREKDDQKTQSKDEDTGDTI